MDRNRIIYLIGFMGSGKTTTGKKLASRLKWSFTDLDKKIEEYSEKSIPEIFSLKGEAFFRTVESEVLKDLASQKNIVISTGGGSPCYLGNMDHMLRTGLTIYLKMNPLQLASRLMNSKGDRPLIKDLNREELLMYIGQKLAEREKWYKQAEIITEGADLDISMLINTIKSKFSI